jgi:hypothetical protein
MKKRGGKFMTQTMQAGQEAHQKLREALSKLLTPEQQEDIYGSEFLPAAQAGSQDNAVFTSRDSKQVWQTSTEGQRGHVEAVRRTGWNSAYIPLKIQLI